MFIVITDFGKAYGPFITLSDAQKAAKLENGKIYRLQGPI